MARLFTGSPYLITPTFTAGPLALPLTFAGWFWWTGTSGANDMASWANSGSSGQIAAIRATAGSGPLSSIIGDGTYGIATTPNSITLNTWQHAAAVWASGVSRSIYLNAGTPGTNTTNLTSNPAVVNRMGFGAAVIASPGDPFNGRLGEWGAWNVALTADEIGQLAKGFSPLFVRPQSLIGYWPLHGQQSPEPDLKGTYNLTLVGAPPAADDHPRIYTPTRARVILGVSAPPATPTYLSPADGATGQVTPVTLSWNAASGASSYDVLFGTVNPPVTVVSANQPGTTYAATVAPGTPYYWQIVARNAAGDTAGPIWSFTTLAVPLPPTTPTPTDGAVNLFPPVTISWVSPDATSWDVYLWAQSLGETLTYRTTVTSPTWLVAILGGLLPGVEYHWGIAAHNAAGVTSGPEWAFTMAPPPPAPIYLSPANGAFGVSLLPTLAWEGGIATSFDVYFGTSPTPPLVASGITVESYAPPALTVDTVYYWRIVAHSASGSTSGPIWVFTTAPEEMEIPPGSSTLLTWIEMLDSAGAVRVSAKVAQPDPGSYYGGYKEDRVREWGSVVRALSDINGGLAGVEFNWTWDDTDRALRTLLSTADTKYLLNRPVVLRMIDDENRRAEQPPRAVMRGLVSSYNPKSPFQFDMGAQDLLTRRFIANQPNSDRVPQRFVDPTAFPTATSHQDTHTDGPHTDLHTDTGHTDTPHDDESHRDNHGDGGSPNAHADAHVDTHGDVQFVDGHEDFVEWVSFDRDAPDPTHGDVRTPDPRDHPIHTDLHSDVRHTDNHTDTHTDAHTDGSHSDGHDDSGHGDSHGDVPGFGSHNDIAHVDIHVDVDHGDTPTGAISGNAQLLGVPIIYGHMSDRFVSERQISTTNTFAPLVATVSTVEAIDESPSGVGFSVGGVSVVVTAVFGTTESAISNPAGTYTASRRAIRANWNAVTGASSYRIYFIDMATAWGWTPFNGSGPPRFVRVFTHNTSAGDGTLGFQMSVVCQNETSGADGLAISLANVDSGKGLVPVISVGQQNNVAVLYHKFLIAGHACKEIEELYVDGIAQNIQIDTTQAGAGGNWLIPGYAGWTSVFGPGLYEDINGHRYTTIYGKVGTYGPDRAAGIITQAVPSLQSDANEAPLSCNVKGIETVGDGSGTLITNVISQFEHAMTNFVFQSYTGGLWLAPPLFPAMASPSVPIPVVSAVSFTDARAVAQARRDGGYVGAGVIGANGDFVSVREVLSWFAQSCDLDIGFNHKGQFFVSMVDLEQSAVLAGLPVDHVSHIHEGSFAIQDDAGTMFNVLPYSFAKDDTGRTSQGWYQSLTIEDEESITNHEMRLTSSALELHFVRDADLALEIASRRLLRHKDPPRLVTLRLGADGFNVELGAILSVTHPEGIGVNGWVNRPVRVERHEADVDEYTVTVTARDMMTAYFNGHADQGHQDAPHDDAHTDTGHFDSHNDTHSDLAHSDGHSDSPAGSVHDDGSHNDESHSDGHTDEPGPHDDRPHGDDPHRDSHFDAGHGDGHIDAAHTDVHTDSHADAGHADTHADESHLDAGHSDIS